MKGFSKYVMVGLVMSVIMIGAIIGGALSVAPSADAAYASWRFNTGDLGGSTNCIQTRMDALDTLVDSMVAGTQSVLESLVDGKYAIVGGDATTGLMVQAVAVTAGTNATETITFAVAFDGAPVVVLTYAEDPGDVRSAFPTSVTASNFLANITADKNYNYTAVGARP